MKPTNHFFLLIAPPQEVVEYVAALKKRVQTAIGHSYNSLHSIAHLSLFQYPDLHNESELYTVSDNISHLPSFDISINGFNVFRNNGTVFLEIVNKHHFYTISEQLKHPVYPHITIARNLKPADLDLAWQVLQKISYSYCFHCRQITVLKRVNGRWASHMNLPLASAH